MPKIDISAAETQLSRLIEDAVQGEEVLFVKGGHPVARLVPVDVPVPVPVRVPGSMKGKIRVADDFDSPLPDAVQAAFEGTNVLGY